MASPRSVDGMLRTLRARWPGVPVHVGPSGIAARASPLGDLAPSDGSRPIPLAARDPREHGRFGAAWQLGLVAALVAADARAITLRRPREVDGVRPAGEALWEHLAGRRGPGGLVPLRVRDSAAIAAVGVLAGDGRLRIVVGNLAARPVEVDLRGRRLRLDPYQLLSE
jgi:hypothetical protein